MAVLLLLPLVFGIDIVGLLFGPVARAFGLGGLR